VAALAAGVGCVDDMGADVLASTDLDSTQKRVCGHKRPAVCAERAHGPPAAGQHPRRARPVVARGGRGLGRARRAGLSLARSGEIGARRTVLTHMSAAMLARLADADTPAAYDGMIVDL